MPGAASVVGQVGVSTQSPTAANACVRAMEAGSYSGEGSRHLGSGDCQKSADDLAGGGVVGRGAGLDRGPQLRVDTDRHDIGRTRSHWRPAPAPSLESFDVVVGLDGLAGGDVDVFVGESAAAARAMGLGIGLGMSSLVCGSRSWKGSRRGMTWITRMAWSASSSQMVSSKSPARDGRAMELIPETRGRPGERP